MQWWKEKSLIIEIQLAILDLTEKVSIHIEDSQQAVIEMKKEKGEKSHFLEKIREEKGVSKGEVELTNWNGI